MERALWLQPLNPSSETGWPCPTCGKGLLKSKKSIGSSLTTASQEARSDDSWDPTWDHGRFSGLLYCSRESCNEVVAVCGNTSVNHDFDPEFGEVMATVFHPVFFNPAPSIFPIPSQCPDDIRAELHRAFSMYWCDKASCANRIRSSVELLLTHLGIKQKGLDPKRKRYVRLQLHGRIELFQKRNKPLGDALLAVKWIGNAGSHPGEMTAEDVLDGFELLEHVLIEVFEKRTQRLIALGKKINRAKGPKRQRRTT